MKKLIVCLLVTAMASPAFAQFYVRTNVGYNLPMGSQLLGTSQRYETLPNADYTENYKGVYGSFGSGFSMNAAFGGQFKKGIFGFDVEFGYLLGKEYTVSSYYSSQASRSETSNSYSSKSFQIAPSMTFTTGSGKVQPFARIGPVIGMTSLTQQQMQYTTYADEEHIWEYRYTGGIGIGFKGVIGATYNISDAIQIFVELDFISMSYSPKKRKMTTYTIDGEDRLDQVSEEEKLIEYEKEYTTESDEYDPPVRPTYPMGSVGMQFGVKFIF